MVVVKVLVCVSVRLVCVSVLVCVLLVVVTVTVAVAVSVAGSVVITDVGDVDSVVCGKMVGRDVAADRLVGARPVSGDAVEGEIADAPC